MQTILTWGIQHQEEQKVENLVYQLTEPVIIYNAIEQLRDLAYSAELPKSHQKLTKYGKRIFKQNGSWYHFTTAEQTWKNFKEHFMKVYNDIIKIKGTTMQKKIDETNKAILQLTKEFSQMKNYVFDRLNALMHVHN